MTYRDFFKRRLIRLHPMVVMGMLIGAAAFYFGAGGPYEMIAGVPVGRMLLILLLGCLMIPVPPSMDIRGWSETYPLDGPAWSLFFEYIANICYALVLRRLSKLLLGALAVVAACFTVRLAVTQGDMIGGWALDGEQLGVGFTRLAYPFIAGLLLSRVGKPIRLRGAFWLCSLCVVAVLAMPHLGTDRLWLNGLYDAVCIIVLFPLVVAAGAGGKVTDRESKKVCGFLGDISYPLYITHYPFVYIYTAFILRGWSIPVPHGPKHWGTVHWSMAAASCWRGCACVCTTNRCAGGSNAASCSANRCRGNFVARTTPAGVAFSCRQFDFSVSFSCTSYASAIRSRG